MRASFMHLFIGANDIYIPYFTLSSNIILTIYI